MFLPAVTLLPHRDGRARAGHPWIFANEVEMTDAAKDLTPGSWVNLNNSRGEPLGTYSWNPGTLIVGRKFSGRPDALIDANWLAERLRHAVKRRGMLPEPFYRLVHSEGDDLPGIVIDRFGPVAVVQLTTASAETLKEPLADALRQVAGIETVVWRRDSPARALEGLDVVDNAVIDGALPEGPLWLRENGLDFAADLRGGQKTGWFYDQRANRAHVATLCKGQRMLDAYSHTGGFGLMAAAGGASEVVFLDRDAKALELAGISAEKQGVAENCAQMVGDVFEVLPSLADSKERFGVVCCDPPAFIKTAKTMATGLKGYEKLAKIAAPLVRGDGFLVLNSCSHHAKTPDFVQACVDGVRKAGRSGRILRLGGADVDHPQHLLLAENAYLKCLTLQLD